MRRRYIYRDGGLIDITRPGEYKAHGQVVPDIQPFQSPVDGTWITSRSELREHNKRNDVVQVGDQRPKPRERVPMPDAGLDIKDSMEFLNSLTKGAQEVYLGNIQNHYGEEPHERNTSIKDGWG